MNLAHRIQTLRKQKGLSQEELALKIGVSRQAVSKWESEQAQPELDKIIQLSDYFEVSTDYLLKGIETHSKTNHPQLEPLLSILPTFLNGIGLLITILLWMHYQTVLCYLPVFLCNAGALMIHFIALSQYPKKEKTALTKKFWRINIWLIAFIPVSLLFGYPLYFFIFPTLYSVIYLIPYFLICLGVTYWSRP